MLRKQIQHRKLCFFKKGLIHLWKPLQQSKPQVKLIKRKKIKPYRQSAMLRHRSPRLWSMSLLKNKRLADPYLEHPNSKNKPKMIVKRQTRLLRTERLNLNLQFTLKIRASSTFTKSQRRWSRPMAHKTLGVRTYKVHYQKLHHSWSEINFQTIINLIQH